MRFVFTYGARSTQPNAEGRDWVVVRASDRQDALAKAAKSLPDPYIVFPIPMHRVASLMKHINDHGLAWIAGFFATVAMLTWAGKGGEEDPKSPWIEDLGRSVALVCVLSAFLVAVLTALDAVCARIYRRASKGEDIAKTVDRMKQAADSLIALGVVVIGAGVLAFAAFVVYVTIR